MLTSRIHPIHSILSQHKGPFGKYIGSLAQRRIAKKKKAQKHLPWAPGIRKNKPEA